MSSRKIDLVFAIDSSQGTPVDAFDQMKNLVQSMLSTYQLSNRHAQVALVNYGNVAQRILTLNEGVSNNMIKNRLGTAQKIGGKRNIEKVIKFVQSDILRTQSGDRSDVYKHVILFIYGPEGISNNVLAAANMLKSSSKDGVTLTVIGAGEQNVEYLREVASSDKNVHLVKIKQRTADLTTKVLLPGIFVDIVEDVSRSSSM